MSSTLRSLAVVGCTAVLVAGVTTAAGATGSSGKAAFTVTPAYGLQNSKVTLSGANFAGETGVTIGGVEAADVSLSSNTTITARVPAGATTGPVVVTLPSKTLTGPTFTVQQQAAGTSTVSRTSLTYTHTAVVTGAVTEAGTGHPVAGELASLQHRIEGSKTWHHAKGVANRKTGAHGLVHFSVKPAVNGFYRVHFFTSPNFTGVSTVGHWIQVLPRIHVNPIRTVPVLSSSQLTGTIRPHLTGLVYLQRFENGAWHRISKSDVVDSKFAFTISPTTLGARSYRVVRKFDGTHSANTTGTLHIQVVNRELSLGDSGSDVRTLQKRLRKLHYDIGPINSDYGWDTLHAVTAFEKVQGLSPNGEVSTQRLEGAEPPQAHSPALPTRGDIRGRGQHRQAGLAAGEERPRGAHPRHLDRRGLPLHQLRGRHLARHHPDRSLHDSVQADRHAGVEARHAVLPVLLHRHRLRHPRRGQRQRRWQRPAVPQQPRLRTDHRRRRPAVLLDAVARGWCICLDLPLTSAWGGVK